MVTARRLADVLPLSPGQEGLLFQSRMNLDGPDAYLVQCHFVIDGPVDPVRLRTCVERLLDRHPNLRACFRPYGAARPVQLIPRSVALPWAEVDLTSLAPAAAEAEYQRLAAVDRTRRFDLALPPLVRCTLARTGRQRADLLVTMHHALIDGWSVAILAGELEALYSGQDPGLPEPAGYARYLGWLRDVNTDQSEAMWRGVLDGIAGPTRLCPEMPRAAVLPDVLEERVPAMLSMAVQSTARAAGVTVNTMAQAAWALVLSRTTASEDVLFGAVVSGRPPELAGVADMVGLFINTVPTRVMFRPGESVRSLLARLQDERTRLSDHHYVPLGRLQRHTGPGGLFDTVLAFENFPRTGLAMNAPAVRLVEVTDGTHYPLAIAMTFGQTLWWRIGYRPDCFSRDAARLVSDRLVRAFSALTSDLDAPADRLGVFTPGERHAVLVAGRGIVRATQGRSVPERFARQAARTPDAMAVESPAMSLTYSQLDAWAHRLSDRLAAAGVVLETPVAILLARTPALVAAQLAVLKAGGRYLALDAGQPAARLALLVRQSGATVALCDGAAIDTARELGLTALAVDNPAAPPAGPAPAGGDGMSSAGSQSPPAQQIDGHNSAYILYTSGSTGEPKGVVITHQGILDLVDDPHLSSAAHARVLQHNPHTFDAVTYEVWVPLLAGGTVVVAPPGLLSPRTLHEVLAAGRITAVMLTAELLSAVAETVPSLPATVREVWAGGDVVSPQAVRRIRDASPGVTIVDVYGPTEATAFATCHAVTDGTSAARIPIGRPMLNMETYVLDSRLDPVPVGVTGELYLGGTGLARGYLGDPARTAERFVASPNAVVPGSRMYRTGDLACWLENRTLQFLGRSDDQVKVRGFRVEPKEIEAEFERCPGVRRAVVDARPDKAGGKRLIAWLQLATGYGLDQVQAHATLNLPAYLQPSAYERLDAIPLTSHGKVDRAGLPEPRPQAAPQAARMPMPGLESTACLLFAEILALPDFAPDANFFEAGGNSLLAMRLVGAVEHRLQTALPVSILYEAPTPALLASRLTRPSTQLDTAPLLAIRHGGDRTPLFCLPPGMGLGWSFTSLLPHLAATRPIYALQSAALRLGAPLPRSIEEIARDCTGRIRAAQPRGPYLLLGRSFGALLAYEMAAQLTQAQERVPLLAVLDSYPVPDGDELREVDPAAAAQEALRILLRNGLPAAGASDEPLDAEAVFAAVRSGPGVLRGANDQELTRLLAICTNHIHLRRSYRPPRYDGPLLLFAATGNSALSTAQKVAAWERTGAQVTVHELDCPHSDVFHPGPAASIAAVLSDRLEEY